MFSASFLCLLSVVSVHGTSVLRKTQTHAPVLVNNPSSASRWLVVPTAKAQHHELRQQSIVAGIASMDTETVSDVDTTVTSSSPTSGTEAQDFFAMHKDMLALHPACQMILTAERHSPSSTLGTHTLSHIHIYTCYVSLIVFT